MHPRWLGEGAHNNEQGHTFRLSLIRDPRFAATVNDSVVESGNARNQDVMDRFVPGDDVPYDVLRQVWQNTTQPHAVWDVPIYEELFRTVRSVNESLPRERQLRVLVRKSHHVGSGPLSGRGHTLGSTREETAGVSWTTSSASARAYGMRD